MQSLKNLLTRYQFLTRWTPGTVSYPRDRTDAVPCFLDNLLPTDLPQTCVRGDIFLRSHGRQQGGGRCGPGGPGCWGHIRSLGAS